MTIFSRHPRREETIFPLLKVNLVDGYENFGTLFAFYTVLQGKLKGFGVLGSLQTDTGRVV